MEIRQQQLQLCPYCDADINDICMCVRLTHLLQPPRTIGPATRQCLGARDWAAFLGLLRVEPLDRQILVLRAYLRHCGWDPQSLAQVRSYVNALRRGLGLRRGTP